MERIIYILLIVLCCSCGARKKTVHTEYDYKRDVELLESRIEQLVEESAKKVVDLSKISIVRIEYSAPDSTGQQHVTAETKTDIGVNITSEEATQVNVVKKDSVFIKEKEEAKEAVAIEEEREGSANTIKSFSKAIWAVVALLVTILIIIISRKILK